MKLNRRQLRKLIESVMINEISEKEINRLNLLKNKLSYNNDHVDAMRTVYRTEEKSYIIFLKQVDMK